MQKFSIRISVFTSNETFYKNLKTSLEDKGFMVERYSAKPETDADYLIVDFTNSDVLEKAEAVLKNSRVKTVSVLKSDQDKITTKLLGLNSYSSVAVVSDLESIDYAEGLIGELFSFGHIGKRFELSGQKVELVMFVPQRPGLSIESASEINDKTEGFTNKEVGHQLLLPRVTVPKVRLPNVKFVFPTFGVLNKKYSKGLSLSILAIVFVLTFSLIFQALSLGALYLSGKNLLISSTKTKSWLSLSKSLVKIADYTDLSIPVYRHNIEIINSLQSLTDNGIELTSESKLLMDKVMGDEIYDITSVSNNISAVLDRVYSDLGFFETLLNNQDYLVSRYFKSALAERGVSIGELRSRVYNSKSLASRLDVLLGSDKVKKYLFVFQNNMELRPTGGFIGSFAVVTVEGGRVLDMNVQDVYSADGQLKGHIEPPTPIKDVLGEANWFLRDSNWDPDFPQSAQRIEWFLDKEIDQQVDGVIAVDLDLLKSLLDVIGEVKVMDYNQVVNSKNVYQVTQNEVESSFFPGSIKKASFLTALSKTLIYELENMESSDKPQVLRKIYDSLNSKHILLYLHDNYSQTAVGELKFGGKLDLSTVCADKCFTDTYGLVDANLGVNKANFFLEREHNLTLNIGKSKLQHKLEVNYVNSANSTLGNMGKYKTYTRLILPVNANVTSLKFIDQSGTEERLDAQEIVVSDRKEVGFLVEVIPLTSKKIEITWEIETNSLAQGGEYRLNILKQPGTDADAYSINLIGTELEYASAIYNFKPLTKTSLTRVRPASYNTRLEKDLNLQVFLKQY